MVKRFEQLGQDPLVLTHSFKCAGCPIDLQKGQLMRSESFKVSGLEQTIQREVSTPH